MIEPLQLRNQERSAELELERSWHAGEVFVSVGKLAMVRKFEILSLEHLYEDYLILLAAGIGPLVPFIVLQYRNKVYRLFV